MELVRRYIGLNRRKGGAVSQITLEEDLNVPDQKPDIFRIIHKQGEFRADEIKGESGKIKVRGVFLSDPVCGRRGGPDAGRAGRQRAGR